MAEDFAPFSRTETVWFSSPTQTAAIRIFMMNGKRIELTSNGAIDLDPSISPDGSRLPLRHTATEMVNLCNELKRRESTD
jgi:Tol biopolymer transport system component